MGFNPKDYYFKKAKKENFAARSVFKLEEIDKKFRVFRRGMQVLDLGASPGSWSQYVSRVVGKGGKILGIDLSEVRLSLQNVTFIKGDIFEHKFLDTDYFDVVMSDMAPKTTGIRITDQARSMELCEKALEIAKSQLRPGGHFVCKIFHSEEIRDFKKNVESFFDKVDLLKPKSTRKASIEIFLIARGRKKASSP